MMSGSGSLTLLWKWLCFTLNPHKLWLVSPTRWKCAKGKINTANTKAQLFSKTLLNKLSERNGFSFESGDFVFSSQRVLPGGKPPQWAAPLCLHLLSGKWADSHLLARCLSRKTWCVFGADLIRISHFSTTLTGTVCVCVCTQVDEKRASIRGMR